MTTQVRAGLLPQVRRVITAFALLGGLCGFVIGFIAGAWWAS
jgi:hypothetical protein